ncbi:MAG TPA: hypothetical protein VFB96_03365 [Pirellulaceae bacterium]|nr:hypothetical protein [Pirellulaceae bacterium]
MSFGAKETDSMFFQQPDEQHARIQQAQQQQSQQAARPLRL